MALLFSFNRPYRVMMSSAMITLASSARRFFESFAGS